MYIDDLTRERLNSIYEEKKGLKGQYTRLIEYFSSDILKAYAENLSMPLIVTMIEAAMKRSFSENNKDRSFYRAVQRHIQRSKTAIKTKEQQIKTSKFDEKIENPILETLKSENTKTIKVPKMEEIKLTDRSSMIGTGNNNVKVNPFNNDSQSQKNQEN